MSRYRIVERFPKRFIIQEKGWLYGRNTLGYGYGYECWTPTYYRSLDAAETQVKEFIRQDKETLRDKTFKPKVVKEYD